MSSNRTPERFGGSGAVTVSDVCPDVMFFITMVTRGVSIVTSRRYAQVGRRSELLLNSMVVLSGPLRENMRRLLWRYRVKDEDGEEEVPVMMVPVEGWPWGRSMTDLSGSLR